LFSGILWFVIRKFVSGYSSIILSVIAGLLTVGVIAFAVSKRPGGDEAVQAFYFSVPAALIVAALWAGFHWAAQGQSHG